VYNNPPRCPSVRQYSEQPSLAIDIEQRRTRNLSSRHWTGEEDRLLLELRAFGYGHRETAARLSDRSVKSVEYRANKIDPKESRPPSVPWSHKEDQKLPELRAEGLKWPAVSEHFPNRSTASVRKRHNDVLKVRGHGRNLSLQTLSWPDFDVALLRHLRDEQRLKWDEITPSFPGRSKDLMSRMYYRIAAFVPHLSRVPYTAAEDATICQLKENGEGWESISAALPNRTVHSVQGRLRRRLKSAYKPKAEGT